MFLLPQIDAFNKHETDEYYFLGSLRQPFFLLLFFLLPASDPQHTIHTSLRYHTLDPGRSHIGAVGRSMIVRIFDSNLSSRDLIILIIHTSDGGVAILNSNSDIIRRRIIPPLATKEKREKGKDIPHRVDRYHIERSTSSVHHSKTKEGINARRLASRDILRIPVPIFFFFFLPTPYCIRPRPNSPSPRPIFGESWRGTTKRNTFACRDLNALHRLIRGGLIEKQ